MILNGLLAFLIDLKVAWYNEGTLESHQIRPYPRNPEPRLHSRSSLGPEKGIQD